jgi:hypothetical protein
VCHRVVPVLALGIDLHPARHATHVTRATHTHTHTCQHNNLLLGGSHRARYFMLRGCSCGRQAGRQAGRHRASKAAIEPGSHRASETASKLASQPGGWWGGAKRLAHGFLTPART